jgi:hypothetical protein
MQVFGDLTLKFSSISIGKRWTFDSYGSEYHYRDAVRGSKYVLTKVYITSESNNPNLPPILVYKLENGLLSLLGCQSYEFRRWKDYGSYLGNYADYGNDFAHSKTIPFNLGLQVSEEELNSFPIFVVMQKDGCFNRQKNSYGNPEIAYEKSFCDYKESLSVDDFEENYHLLKVFNSNLY